MPTEAGRAYYERCARILDDVAEAELALGTLQAAPRGRLRINCPMAMGILHIAPAIAAFCKTYPEIRADLVMNDRAVDMASRQRANGRGTDGVATALTMFVSKR